MKILLMATLALALAARPALSQDFDNVEIKATHIAGPVWTLVGAGGNIGVSVGPDGVLLIDDQFAPLSEKIRAAIDRIGGGDLRFVLNTHYHRDHTGGNPYFGKLAPILAQRNVRKRLAAGSGTTPPLTGNALPTITYDDGISIFLNGEEIRVFHVPAAHTDGDSVVWFTGSNVVHMGELLFLDRFPFVDLDGGGTLDGYLAGMQRVLDTVPADATFIAGHGGPLATAEQVRADLATLRESVGVIKQRMDAGADLEELLAQGLPAKFDSWSWEFIPTDKWITTVYKSYS